MKIKHLSISLALILSMSLSSCNDWLTVLPKNQSPSDKMFESESGFQMSLTGLYLLLKVNYNPESMLMGGQGIEYMANNYAIQNTANTSSWSYLLSHHIYTDNDLDRSLGFLFQSNYKTITNANVLLDGIRHQKKILPEKMAKLMEGEALAIRAFCHFDLLRLWGPVPLHPNKSSKYLPYVKEMNTERYPYITYDEFIKDLKDDLTQALALLKDADPILRYSNSQLNAGYVSINEYSSMFWYYRQKRFNYYSVEALLARLALWTGDKASAYKYAKDIIDAKNEDGTSKFQLGAKADISSNDFSFYKEHLMGLDTQNYTDRYNSFRTTYVNKVSVIENTLYHNEPDIRLNLLQRNNNTATWGDVYGTLKYSKLSSTDYGMPKSVPLIRLAEIYLIAIETAPLSEANTYYKTFCESRNASYAPLTADNLQDKIIEEYVKEFFGEGQTFFAYKRLGSSKMLLNDMSVTEGEYVLPIPQDEIGYYK